MRIISKNTENFNNLNKLMSEITRGSLYKLVAYVHNHNLLTKKELGVILGVNRSRISQIVKDANNA